jgi:hypothetical protein
MEETDQGVVISVGDRHGIVLLSFTMLESQTIAGALVRPDGASIVLQGREAVVEAPVFLLRTAYFTADWTPYSIRRKILVLIFFTFMQRER